MIFWVMGAVAYLLVWLLLSRSYAQDQLRKEDRTGLDNDDWMVIGILLLWPLVIIAAAVAMFCKAVRWFLTWDMKAWRARRSTKRIESDLAKEKQDVP